MPLPRPQITPRLTNAARFKQPTRNPSPVTNLDRDLTFWAIAFGALASGPFRPTPKSEAPFPPFGVEPFFPTGVSRRTLRCLLRLAEPRSVN
jgi:hypothetical protein